MTYQPISKNDIYLGLDRTIAAIKAKYPDAGAASSAPFSGYMGLNIDPSILSTGSLKATDSNFFDGLFNHAGKEVENAITGFVLDGGEKFLKSQHQMSLSLTKDIYVRTLTGISIEKAIAQALDDGTIKYYVEKSTGVIVQTEKFSETTHIPLGKFLAGAGHAVTAYAIYDALKDPIKDAYNSVTGAGNTIDPLKSYTAAAVGIIAGGAIGGMLAAASFPALAVLAATAATSYVGVVATKAVLDSVPAVIDSAKAAGKSLAETLGIVSDFVGDKVDEAYAATGDKAKAILEDAEKYAQDLSDGMEQLADDYGWALDNPADALNGLLPDWLVPAGGIFGDVPAIPILRGWGDPLVLDLDGDGVEVTKMGFGSDRSMVYFDMDNDGVGDWKTRSPHGGGDDKECGLWLQTYSNNNAEFEKSQAA